uniref:Putative secreted protein n=1 Tax=Amblyomma parvum TaxID=251391 RepID=A0A023G300_AMBPA
MMRGILLVILPLSLQLNTVANHAKPDVKEKIGEGVTVKVNVIYDWSYLQPSTMGALLEKIRSNNTDDPFREYFHKLFFMVQQHFNNQSVMINITVESIHEMKNISVPYAIGQHSINGSQTLQKLEEYGRTLQKPDNTIFSLFIVKNIYQWSTRGDHVPYSLTELATHGSFCTGNTSAAVVKVYFAGRHYLATAHAFAEIFGSSTYTRFSREDLQAMNGTFQRCKHEEAVPKTSQ